MEPMIGNEQDATFINSWVHENMEHGRPSLYSRENPPEGWEFVGKGSYRSVWKSPEGVLYKVQHYAGGDNMREWRNYQRIVEDARIIPGCRIPKMSYIPIGDGREGIIAAECINGRTVQWYYDEDSDAYPDEYSDLVFEMETKWRLGDLHMENVMVDEDSGELVAVDLGY